MPRNPVGAARGAVRGAAKGAVKGAARQVSAGARKVAQQVPGYGEVRRTGVQTNRPGDATRKVAKKGKKKS